MKYRSSLRRALRYSIKFFLSLFPIQNNKIVFLNSKGKGYGDNPKYIAEEIIHQRLPWKMVWLVCGSDFTFPKSITYAQLNGLSGFYHLSTAKIIISNFKNNIPPYFINRKKKNQFYLQTWHGDLALKYLEKEIEDTFSPSYLAVSKADSAATNAILSGNSSFSTILKESFWLPKDCEILEFGVPRNDIYFGDNSQEESLRQQYGFSLEDRILLYAPTFRDNKDLSCYNLDFDRLIQYLSKGCSAKWKIIVRLHPSISSNVELFNYDDRIINGSCFSDQQELCFISDCLITDYSSIMGDFLLMKKPVFLYVPDLEKYSDRSSGRGLRDCFYHLPFSFSRSQAELESNFSNFIISDYRDKVDAFMQVYYKSFDDGYASQRVVNYLKGVLV